MFPYVRRVLENPNNWMIHTMALLLRSRLESNKSRTVERGCLQLQALVDQFGVHDSSAAERMMYLFSIAIPMKWEMEVIAYFFSVVSIRRRRVVCKNTDVNVLGTLFLKSSRYLPNLDQAKGVFPSSCSMLTNVPSAEWICSLQKEKPGS